MNRLSKCLNMMAIIVVIFVVSGARTPPELPTQTIMKGKLRHAQSALKGVVKADFPGIEADAKVLEQFSKMDGWMKLQTSEYQRYSEAFRRTVRSMAQHARDKNLDGCTLNYVQMTMACVECHKYVRGQSHQEPPAIGKQAPTIPQ